MFWAEQFPVIWRSTMFLNTPTPLVIVSSIAMMCSILLLYLNLFKQWRGAAYEATLFTMYILLGIPLLLCFTQCSLILNGRFDSSEPHTFQTSILSKRISHSSKGGTQWYLDLEDWREPSQTVQLAVDETEYQKASSGTPVEVQTRKGFFGFEWLVRYHIDQNISS